jgi:hypothetical protein
MNEKLLNELFLYKNNNIFSENFKFLITEIIEKESLKKLKYLDNLKIKQFKENAFNYCYNNVNKFDLNKSNNLLSYIIIIIRSSFSIDINKLKYKND